MTKVKRSDDAGGHRAHVVEQLRHPGLVAHGHHGRSELALDAGPLAVELRGDGVGGLPAVKRVGKESKNLSGRIVHLQRRLHIPHVGQDGSAVHGPDAEPDRPGDREVARRHAAVHRRTDQRRRRAGLDVEVPRQFIADQDLARGAGDTAADERAFEVEDAAVHGVAREQVDPQAGDRRLRPGLPSIVGDVEQPAESNARSPDQVGRLPAQVAKQLVDADIGELVRCLLTLFGIRSRGDLHMAGAEAGRGPAHVGSDAGHVGLHQHRDHDAGDDGDEGKQAASPVAPQTL